MMLRSLLLFLFVVFTGAVAVAQYTIDSIPNPKTKGQAYYVSNPDDILQIETVDELDVLSQGIDSSTGAEYVVVVVNDYAGENDFDFAFKLFNRWGIGKRENNNGLLLFIAKNRNEYRFISGYGMESVFPDVALKRIGEKYLVPHFRNNDFDRGILEASHFIAHILKSPDAVKEMQSLLPEVVSFWSFRNPVLIDTVLILLFFVIMYMYSHFVAKKILPRSSASPKLLTPVFYGMGCMLLLMFSSLFIFTFVFHNLEDVYQKDNIPYFTMTLSSLILAMKITDGRSRIIDAFKDEYDLQEKLKRYVLLLGFPMILTPLSWFDLWSITNRIRRNRGRFIPPDDSGNWVRINRSNHKEARRYLDSGQKKEEAMKSLRYEIWRNTKEGNVHVQKWDIVKDFSTCPKCNYYTLKVDETRTLRAATYSSSGEGERFDKCDNCGYLLLKGKFTISRKVKSSSGGGRSGGSSRSGGSRSGSFGGGSSGGGGAGGRW